MPNVRRAIADAVIGAVNGKVEAGDFDSATGVLAQMRDFLPPAIMTQLFEFAYSKWAERHMAKQQWREAINVYEQGLKQLPASSLFKQNLAYCVAKSGN